MRERAAAGVAWPSPARAGDTGPVPWCDGCDRFYNPNTLRPDGTCPSCGRPVAAAAAGSDAAPEGERAPWHFKLLVTATAAYLGWRLVQGVIWVVEHL